MEWEQEAVKAHEEEIKLAIQNHQTYQGKPWLRVAVDGGWQKQSHGHSYSSSSGKNHTQYLSFIITALCSFVTVKFCVGETRSNGTRFEILCNVYSLPVIIILTSASAEIIG